MLLYICTNFHENILEGIKVKVKADKIFIRIISIGHKVTKIVGGVAVLVL